MLHQYQCFKPIRFDDYGGLLSVTEEERIDQTTRAGNIPLKLFARIKGVFTVGGNPHHQIGKKKTVRGRRVIDIVLIPPW